MSALVIPCYIKSQWDIDCLKRVLGSVADQSVPFKHVYVVDDASPLNYSLEFGFVNHIKLSENGGPAKARNVGIERALGQSAEQLFFTDHDCILDKDWNAQMTSFLKESNFAAVGGMTYSWGKTLLDYYHDINGTLAGKWLLPVAQDRLPLNRTRIAKKCWSTSPQENNARRDR